MKQLKFTSVIGTIAVFLLSIKFANANSDSTKIYFQQSFTELKNMLEGKQPMNFEKAVFITENPYLNNRFDFNEFQNSVDAHVYLIEQIANANDKSASIDFSVKIDPNAKKFDINTLNFTEKEKKDMYRKTLHNWAIYTYLNDTTYLYGVGNLPFTYQFNDPFGMNDWKNSQVSNLLFNSEKKGNCFALVSLFKILSDRLNSEAYICTAPQHIYIQHQDHKGDYYNVELATGTHPGDGSIQTLTYTFYDGIVSGISLRRLKEEKQNIALCLVNLGKSYEHKFKTKDDEFLLQGAELALKYDSLNLNAMLLKEQVFEARVIQYASKKNITDINKLRTDANISYTFKKLESQIVHLYELGYYQMPLYMQEMILSALKREDNKPIIVQDRTPDPFPSIKNAAPEDKRYSTLSGGLFEEVKVKKQFEQYGQFTLDTKTMKLVKILDSTNFKFLIDPVVFAWSVDPLAHKYPSWSPYAAFANNPILYIDEDGKEPARNRAGTIEQAMAQWKANKKTTVNDILNYIDKNKDAVRYIYTEDKGWIDMAHYFGTIKYGKTAMDLLEPASGSKILQETIFGEGADKSYYSYEDLPSNKFGSEAPVFNITERYSPTEKGMVYDVKQKTGEGLLNAIEGQFKAAGATNPENAPNWQQIPLDDQDRSRLPKNWTSTDLQSGDYVPQNRSDKPYSLNNFPAASTSLQKQELQK